MTRKILALAAAVIAAPALFASAAQACISCEYTPEVVKGSQTSDAPAYRARSYERSYERTYVERDRAPAKKRVVRSEPEVKKIDNAEVEKPAPAKKVAVTEDSAPAKTASNENSSISVAAVEPQPVTEKAKSENSSIASASSAASAKKAPAVDATKEASAKPVDCKKFFASVGMTLTVPCE